MAISSEIEKLERRWHENPSGLMFAPLAEAYRKAGNHQRALEILEVGLAVHPDYVPALIVRGRCLLDAGDHAASESAFQQVLARDPANPIALRSLADLFERSGQVNQAMERLSLLLEVDAGDGEARASLERLRSQPAVEELPALGVPVTEAMQAPAEHSEPLAEPAVPEPPAAAGSDASPFRIENLSVDPMTSGEQALPAEPPGWEPTSIASVWSETVMLSLLDAEPGDAGPASPEAEPAIMEEAPVVPEPEVIPTPAEVLPAPVMTDLLAPIIWTPVTADSGPPEPEATAEATPAEAAPEEPLAAGVGEVASEEGIPESQVTAEVAPPESPEAAALAWPVIEEPIVAEEPIVEEPEPSEPVVSATVSEVPMAEPAPEEPTLIVTESMAELFLKQGHRELALAVYRQLAERAPEEPRLRQAIAALEAELAPPAAEPAAEPARYAAALTGGLTVESALQSVLRSPPPPTASTVLPPAIEPGLPGEAPRAPEQALTLGAVFGDEAPLAPVSAEADAPSGPAEPSYDEFFGAGPSSEPAASASATGRPAEAEDLRQFNEWLKGLKR